MAKRTVAEEIGDRLRGLRSDRGWSLNRLARETALSPEAIRRIELGRSWPEQQTLEVLAEALDTTVRHLLGMEQAS